MQPGLRRLAEGSHQLHPNARDSRHLLEKLQALGTPAPSALQCVAGYDPMAGAACAGRACRGRTSRRPSAGTAAPPARGCWAGRCATASCGRCGAAPMAAVGSCLAQLPPAWRLAGLLSLAFAEDFALIDGRTAQIPWLAVALPSHWAPEQKVGLHFAQVHAPVADNSVLLAAGEALARLVSAPTRWERFVWTVTPRPTLNAHPALQPATHGSAADADGVAAQAWWRTERQTFIPVPDASAGGVHHPGGFPAAGPGHRPRRQGTAAARRHRLDEPGRAAVPQPGHRARRAARLAGTPRGGMTDSCREAGGAAGRLRPGAGLPAGLARLAARTRHAPTRLDFIALTPTPPDAAALRQAHRGTALQPLAEALAAQWPPLTRNLHRLSFEAATGPPAAGRRRAAGAAARTAGAGPRLPDR